MEFCLYTFSLEIKILVGCWWKSQRIPQSIWSSGKCALDWCVGHNRKKRKGSMFRGRRHEIIGLFILSYLYPSVHGAGTDLMIIFHVFRGSWKEIHVMRVAVSIQATRMYARGPREEVIGKQSSQGSKGWDERRGKGLQCHWQLLWERPPCSQAVLEHQNGKEVTLAWLWPWSQQKQAGCSRLGENKSLLERPEMTSWTNVLPLMPDWYGISWNIDYSGKKRKREGKGRET